MDKENHHKNSKKIIRSFEAVALRKRPFIAKLADFLTSYFGTVSFLVGNFLLYGIWILGNSGYISNFPIFDPHPYSLMNSFVSIEAIFLTIIVLMSQNRENQRDILRQELSLQIELISEREITKILKLLKEVKSNKDDRELAEMIEEIDATYLERKLTEQLEKAEESILQK